MGPKEKDPKIKVEQARTQEYTKVEDLTPEQIAMYEAYMADLPPAPESKEMGEELLEFESMIQNCEANHPIAEIASITTVKEALASPERKKLKEALDPISTKLRLLHEAMGNNDTFKARFAELKERYLVLSNAVGALTVDGGIDRDRKTY